MPRMLLSLSCLAALALDSCMAAGDTSSFSHAGFPVKAATAGQTTYTYMSVEDPEALNLDGSRYGIAVCLSETHTDDWVFSADGGGWCYDELECFQRASTGCGCGRGGAADAADAVVWSVVRAQWMGWVSVASACMMACFRGWMRVQ
jgi:hypothetical protein